MKVKVGPILYDVKLVDGLFDDHGKLNGLILHNDCEILIERSLHDQEKYCTMWHEIIHAIMSQAGIADQDESFVSTLAYGIVNVIKGNPDIMLTYIGDEERNELLAVIAAFLNTELHINIFNEISKE